RDPELGPQVPVRQPLHRPAVARIPHAESRSAPAARLTERPEQVLLHDVAGKPVGIDASLALGVGENINLTMRLLEWLRDAQLREALPPGQHMARFRLHRMPEPDANIGGLEIEALSLLVGDAFGLRQPRDPALAELERPDQPPRHAFDQRLVKIAR